MSIAETSQPVTHDLGQFQVRRVLPVRIHAEDMGETLRQRGAGAVQDRGPLSRIPRQVIDPEALVAEERSEKVGRAVRRSIDHHADLHSLFQGRRHRRWKDGSRIVAGDENQRARYRHAGKE